MRLLRPWRSGKRMRRKAVGALGVFLGLSAAIAFADPASEDAERVLRERAAVQAQFAEVNAANPMSTDSNSNSNANLAGLLQAMQNPTFQRVLRVSSDLNVLQSTQKIVLHPNRSWLGYGELVWILLIFVLRFWRMSLADTWYKKLWVQVWSGALFFGGAFTVLPWLVFGDAFFEWISAISRAIRSL